jgi:hypothetical protein
MELELNMKVIRIVATVALIRKVSPIGARAQHEGESDWS